MFPVIMAITPYFAELILSGKKTVEFRKAACPAQRLFIYATAPVKRIIGECRIAYGRQGSPDVI